MKSQGQPWLFVYLQHKELQKNNSQGVMYQVAKNILHGAFYALSLFTSTGLLATAQAANVSVNPLRVEFSASHTGEALTLKNTGTTPVTIQPSVMKWSQTPEGKDELVATKEVLVAPALTEIAPGDTQIVRVALRRAPDPQQQLSYRILLREVPKDIPANSQQVQIVINISLPVFVASSSPATPPKLDVTRDAAGKLIVRNPGNSHVQVKEFTLTDSSKGQYKSQTMFYLLAQQQRTLSLPTTTGLGAGPWQFNAKTDRGDLSITTR
jgi:fimbrial chaperone protein